jgi:protein involved in polysaccharide export with SLBB domain
MAPVRGPARLPATVLNRHSLRPRQPQQGQLLPGAREPSRLGKITEPMRFLLTLFAVSGLLCASGLGQANATLRSGDMFELRLSGVPAEAAAEFSLLYTVGSDGSVNIPLIKDPVKAEGTTPTQLQRTIESRLVAEKIFTRPTVVINVQNAARTVFVGGNVRAPSRVPWSNDLTVISAINSAGGVSEFAGDKIRLIRGGKYEVYSRKSLTRDPANDPKVLPGDQIEQQ